MAVTFGNGGGLGGDFVAQVTITSVTTTGSDRVGIAGVGGSTDNPTVSIEWGTGNSMTSEGSATVGSGFTHAFSLIAPPEASSSIVFSSTVNIVGGCVWLYVTGASQSDAVSASDTDTSTGGAMSAAPASASGDMGVLVGGVAGGTLTSVDGTEVANVHNGDSQYFGAIAYKASVGASVTLGYTCDDDGAIVVLNIPQSGGAVLEQEGFRWGVDDDTESAHTFEAAQDTNISIADDQSRLIRILVDATGDEASTAYTLRYQKNGSGGYVAVPVGASTKTTPVIEAGDATETGNNTASTSWAVGYPNASTGDLLIFCISWDDSTATTDVAEPAGPNGETLSEINATPATDSGTLTRCKCWYTVATGTWTASTLTFTPTASEQWTAAVIRVPAGEFDSGTPIGGSGVNTTAGGTDTDVLNAAFTAGGTDGSGKLCTWTSADADPQTVASGWTEVANEDRGAVSGGFFTRDTAVTDSESVTAGTVSTIASGGWASVSFVVRAPTVNNEVYIATSANITAGGEATTARLTAPSGKTTSDFTTGRRWDNENGSDSIDIAEDFYTEVEWLVYIAASASASDFFDFRVYAGSSALDTYTVTPRWTIPSAGGLSIPIAMYHYQRMQRH